MEGRCQSTFGPTIDKRENGPYHASLHHVLVRRGLEGGEKKKHQQTSYFELTSLSMEGFKFYLTLAVGV